MTRDGEVEVVVEVVEGVEVVERARGALLAVYRSSACVVRRSSFDVIPKYPLALNANLLMFPLV